MAKKSTIRFLCFLIGSIYIAITILHEYLGIGLYESLTHAIAAGRLLNRKSILLGDALLSFGYAAIFVTLYLNIFTLFYIGFVLFKPFLSRKIYLSIIIMLLILLGADVFLLSFKALLFFIFGFPYHIYFLIFFLKNKKFLMNTTLAGAGQAQ